MDVVIVGAGQGGLAVSYLLEQGGIEHVILERGRIGESWRSQRWDSFYLNTPNWSNNLPGMEFHPEAPDGFGHRDQIVSYLENYAGSFNAPVMEGAKVSSVERLSSGRLQVQAGSDAFDARAVVIASGSMNRPRLPAMARELPADITSLTAGTYRNAAELPDGAVLIVGGAQSGCQIAEDLIAAGRRVYLCASRVGRIPRRYRGRDILYWWRDMGFWDVRLEDLEDPAMRYAALPQVSGVAGGRTVSFQSLARDGVTLLGRLQKINGYNLELRPDLRASIAFADVRSASFKEAIDAFITRSGMMAPLPEPDPGEPAMPDLRGSDRMESLNLREVGISSIIWCTGFDADWSWLRAGEFDAYGHPQHLGGVGRIPGLYFIGLPWLSKRKSGTLYGIPEDAGRIVEHLDQYLG